MATKGEELARAFPATRFVMSRILLEEIVSTDVLLMAFAEWGGQGHLLPPAMPVSPSGPLGNAAMDEPLFILRAQDKIAPDVVERWHNLAMASGVKSGKVLGSLDVHRAMLRWQRSHPECVKIPD